MFLEPWANNDPKDPEAAVYWLVDGDTTLPANVAPNGVMTKRYISSVRLRQTMNGFRLRKAKP